MGGRPQRTADAVQWRVPDVVGVEASRPSGIRHRDFMGINFNWKLNRTMDVPHDETVHTLDEELKGALESQSRSNDPRPSFDPPRKALETIRDSLVLETGTSNPRVWFYRNECLVVDFRTRGRRVAFDIAEKGSCIEISVLGRDATSVACMEMVYEDLTNARPISSTRWFVKLVRGTVHRMPLPK
ncbi:hypothetical protein GCM10023166_09670 [Paeniglutamicibacter cryotolerans]